MRTPAAPKALVLGSLSRVLLAVIRSLGRGGVEVHLGTDAPDPSVLRSRYLYNTHALPSSQASEGRWIQALCDLMKRGQFDVVMPCTDWDTLLCHYHRKALEQCGSLYVPNEEAFEILFNKRKTSEWARKVNVRTPREIDVTTPQQANRVLETFSFPVVLKPRQTFQLSNPGGYQQVAKAYSEPEFYTHLAALQQSGDVVVQENFIGQGVGVELLMDEGQPLMAFQHERVHEPLQGGPSSYRKSVSLSRELLEASLQILQPLNYTGVAMVEFKVNEQQRDEWVLIEVNPRFWGSLPLTIAAGADFPLALFQLWVYNRTSFPQSYRTGVYCRDLSMDLFWLKANLFANHADPTLETRPRHKVLSEALLHVLTGRERFDSWAADDLGPGIVVLRSVLRRIGRKLLPRRNRLDKLTMDRTSYVEKTLDFDLHGIVRVRLINPSARDAAVFIQYLGAPQSPSQSGTDIVIRFEEMAVPVGFTYLGLNDAGFTREGFYLLDGNNGNVHARIPFASIGERACEVICQRGLGAVPLIDEIILFTFLKKSYVPLHASAFLHKNAGILVTGWTKGGKTESLLAFVNQGARYVGDEWVLLSADGARMFGLPVPVTVWEWQFKYIPKLLPKISNKKKLLFRGVHLLTALHQTVQPRRQRNFYPLKLLDMSLPTLKRKLRLVEWPQTLFANRRHTPDAPLNKVFLAMSANDPGIQIKACKPEEIALRMAQSNSDEQTNFFRYYRAFKFAFPDRRNEFLETVHERQSALLFQALTGKEAYTVTHPYPVALDELYRQLQPLCEHLPGRET